MIFNSLPLANTKPDLRTARVTTIQKGLKIRLLRVIILVLLDILALTLALNIAVFYGTVLPSPWTQESSFMLLTITLEIFVIAARGLYKAGSHRCNYINIIKTVSLGAVLLLLIAFLYEPNYYVSRSTFILIWLLSIIFTCTARLIFDQSTKVLRDKGAIRHPVFLITEPENQDNHIKLIEKQNCYSIENIDTPICLDLANRKTTFKQLHKQGIEEVFISWDAIKNRLYVCWHFQNAGITLRIVPKHHDFYDSNSIFWKVQEVPYLTISAPIITGTDFWLKRYFDIICASILLILLSPVYLVIAILIKLDSPGSILFKQERIGLHSRKFKIWKFRTMVANAEKLQASLENKNEIKDGVLFKLKDDPRITRVGKFLRRYSLDELPQLFNVLVGEMSLVGPRPLPERDVKKFTRHHFIRQEVLPGITGLWQVSGRSDIDKFEDAVKLDIDYIETWSLWLDMQILLKTVNVVLQKTGAY
ncbi:sugar transferase [Calothrix rhizosoleniae]|uniref:sugar transferase n=1 Tax=Calothrix rhizosoleniae TaxID=888997 RepID=UPI000B49B174|nr:sugar transferase [Calothrix rhizosoleniae]